MGIEDEVHFPFHPGGQVFLPERAQFVETTGAHLVGPCRLADAGPADGDKVEFAIPYDLAYGIGGRGPIPGGATLLFTVELLSIGGAA